MADSLGGNARTLMFVNCSPSEYNASETIAALRFAERCKKVENQALGKNVGGGKQVNKLKGHLDGMKKGKGRVRRRKSRLTK